jgi:hypothetical protein
MSLLLMEKRKITVDSGWEGGGRLLALLAGGIPDVGGL